MANPEHLEILRQGVEAWNKWREENPSVHPDLSGANLTEADLSDAVHGWADLVAAHLTRADLSGADLSGADLSWADLRRADLRRANLRRTLLSRTNLCQANLSEALLWETYLTWADLTQADLREARLLGAHFTRTDLAGADLSKALVNGASFCETDLSVASGLTTVEHLGPSSIGIDTIYLSKSGIPHVFLHGCGIPDRFIAFAGSPVGGSVSYHSCFISYSSEDRQFAERLYADLQSNKIRCWFAPEHMRIGDRVRLAIDHAIQQHDRLCLVLSGTSIASQWVEAEVESALTRERREGKTILFPIRIDDTVMETDAGWAAYLRNTRHIGDFTQWKDHDAYQEAFERLLRDLIAETD